MLNQNINNNGKAFTLPDLSEEDKLKINVEVLRKQLNEVWNSSLKACEKIKSLEVKVQKLENENQLLKGLKGGM